MWKKIDESKKEISEDDIVKTLEVVYRNLEDIQLGLSGSTDIKLREKYMRPISDFLNWLDYEI